MVYCFAELLTFPRQIWCWWEIPESHDFLWDRDGPVCGIKTSKHPDKTRDIEDFYKLYSDVQSSA